MSVFAGCWVVVELAALVVVVVLAVVDVVLLAVVLVEGDNVPFGLSVADGVVDDSSVAANVVVMFAVPVLFAVVVRVVVVVDVVVVLGVVVVKTAHNWSSYQMGLRFSNRVPFEQVPDTKGRSSR